MSPVISSSPKVFIHLANLQCAALIESHCPDCGFLICLSRYPELLAAAEKAHKCLLDHENRNHFLKLSLAKQQSGENNPTRKETLTSTYPP